MCVFAICGSQSKVLKLWLKEGIIGTYKSWGEIMLDEK